MSPWDIPVFRSAFFPKRVHRTLFSKTLDLQVRFAHPPNPAPSSRFFSISRRSGLMAPLCKGSCPPQRTEGLSPWGRGQGEGARSPLPQSPHRIGFSSRSGVPVGLFGKPKRSTSSRFAASIEAHCAVSSETLMLQVRFALPPNPAPSSRFFSISRRSGLRGCPHRAESTHHLTPSGCVPSGGAGAPPAPPLPPPSRCRPDRFKGSP